MGRYCSYLLPKQAGEKNKHRTSVTDLTPAAVVKTTIPNPGQQNPVYEDMGRPVVWLMSRTIVRGFVNLAPQGVFGLSLG